MPDESFFKRWETIKAIDKGGRIETLMREIEEGALALAAQWSRLSRDEILKLAEDGGLAAIRERSRELPEILRPPQDPCMFAIWAVIDLPFALAGRRFK